MVVVEGAQIVSPDSGVAFGILFAAVFNHCLDGIRGLSQGCRRYLEAVSIEFALPRERDRLGLRLYLPIRRCFESKHGVQGTHHIVTYAYYNILLVISADGQQLGGRLELD